MIWLHAEVLDLPADNQATASRTAPRCSSLGECLGTTGCQCGAAGDVEVFFCLAGHGREISLADGTLASVCQLANHQAPLTGRWPLPRLPSCSTCDHFSLKGQESEVRGHLTAQPKSVVAARG